MIEYVTENDRIRTSVDLYYIHLVVFQYFSH